MWSGLDYTHCPQVPLRAASIVMSPLSKFGFRLQGPLAVCRLYVFEQPQCAWRHQQPHCVLDLAAGFLIKVFSLQTGVCVAHSQFIARAVRT